MVKKTYCTGKCNFVEDPYYKFVREMVKLLNMALARVHFLINEGLSQGGLNETQDLSLRTIQNVSFSPAANIRRLFSKKNTDTVVL